MPRAPAADPRRLRERAPACHEPRESHPRGGHDLERGRHSRGHADEPQRRVGGNGLARAVPALPGRPRARVHVHAP
eukprot:5070809-Alexandrium_andersonii.AAC.1